MQCQTIDNLRTSQVAVLLSKHLKVNIHSLATNNLNLYYLCSSFFMQKDITLLN